MPVRARTRVTTSVLWGGRSRWADLMLLWAFGGVCECGGALAAKHQRTCLAVPMNSNCNVTKRRTVFRTGSGMDADFVVRVALSSASLCLLLSVPSLSAGAGRHASSSHPPCPRASHLVAPWLLSNSAPHSLHFPPFHSNCWRLAQHLWRLAHQRLCSSTRHAKTTRHASLATPFRS